jgi:hypothetical protein
MAHVCDHVLVRVDPERKVVVTTDLYFTDVVRRQ